MDTLNRRLRYTPQSTGHKFKWTPYQRAILSSLYAIPMLRRDMLHAHVGGYITTFKETLTNLFHEGYITKPIEQERYYSPLSDQAIYTITDKGVDLLREWGDLSPTARTVVTATKWSPHHEWAHDLLICDLLACLKVGIEQKGLRFIPVYEILADAPEKTRLSKIPTTIRDGDYDLTPDALFGIEHPSGTRAYFALEADRGTEQIRKGRGKNTSIQEKIEDYQELGNKGTIKTHWNIPNLRVLFLTTVPGRVRNMKDMTKEVVGPSKRFLFKAAYPGFEIGAIPKPLPELVDDYERAGFDPISITEEPNERARKDGAVRGVEEAA